MENVVKITNSGALPREQTDTDEPRVLELPEPLEIRPAAEETHENSEPIIVESSDKPPEHVRSPELRRHGTKLLMTVTAAIGAAAGARLIFWGEPSAVSSTAVSAISQTLIGTFGEIFFRQAALGAMFLCVEFLLGFFALGDLLVWTMPFLCAMGTVLRLSAAGSPKILPGAVICLGAVVFGASYSADMSGLLMRLSRGGTVYMESNPKRTYVLRFLGSFAAVLLGAVLAGVLMNV